MALLEVVDSIRVKCSHRELAVRILQVKESDDVSVEAYVSNRTPVPPDCGARRGGYMGSTYTASKAEGANMELWPLCFHRNKYTDLAGNNVIHPGVEFKAIKADALLAHVLLEHILNCFITKY